MNKESCWPLEGLASIMERGVPVAQNDLNDESTKDRPPETGNESNATGEKNEGFGLEDIQANPGHSKANESNTSLGEGARRTKRPNAGHPPDFYGTRGPERVYTRRQPSQPKKKQVTSVSVWGAAKSTASTTGSTVKKAEIEEKKIERIAQLEKKQRDRERELCHMERELEQKKRILEQIKVVDPSEDFNEMEEAIATLEQEILRGKADLPFDKQDMEAERQKIIDLAEVEKLKVMEGEENLHELDTIDKKTAVDLWTAFQADKTDQSDGEDKEGSDKESSDDDGEEEDKGDDMSPDDKKEIEELTKRLTKLKNIPITKSTKEKVKSKQAPKLKSTGNNVSTNPFSDLTASIAEAIRAAIPSASSSDKLLARQVQGKDLPIFTGRPEEWPAFVTNFENSTKNCGYTTADNLPRLLKCLKGEALRTVQCMLINPESVPKVIEKLRKRFGRPEIIIANLITKLRDIPAVKQENIETLVEFGIAVDDLTSTIIALNAKDHLANPMLLNDLLKKMPVSLQLKWMEDSASKVKNLETYSEWLGKITDSAYALCPPKSHDTKQEKRQGRNQSARIHATSEEPRHSKSDSTPKPRKCMDCNKTGHRIQECKSFENKPLATRNQIVREKKLCFGCLNYGHPFKECKSRKPCNVDKCGKPHHRLLHSTTSETTKSTAPPPEEPKPKENTEGDTAAESMMMASQSNRVNHMVLPAIIKGPLGEEKIYVVLDSYSSITTLTKGVAERLGIKGESVPLRIKGVNSTATYKSQSVSVILEDVTRKCKYQVKNVRTVDHLDLPRHSFLREDIRNWPHLQDIPLETYQNIQPSMLIGQDNPYLFIQQDNRLGRNGAPPAVKTPLGWVVIGKLDGYNQEDYSLHMREEKDEDLHQLVKGFFTLESAGIKTFHDKPRSRDDMKAQGILDSTLKKVNNGWETGLLWKDETVTLPESRTIALRRLFSMERKMDRDQEFGLQYVDRIQEYIDKGFARKLSTEEASQVTTKTYYLPHFMAYNPKKPKKYRFVFDAAAKSKGKCLNDFLLQGPDKLTSLPGMLIKFRQRPIALTADIKDFFHRVKVRSIDADAQRFLWRGFDRSKTPCEYIMDVLIFGASCSPACAQEAKNRNASELKIKYPEAYDTIVNQHYVDDMLDCCNSSLEAIKLFQDTLEVQRIGGFHLVNWLSNSKEVMETIPEELRAKSMKDLTLDNEVEVERILGLFWKPDQDHFTFSLNFLKAKEDIMNGSRIPIKRELLSLVMSIYDPLGFLAPLTVKAKIILQKAWRSGIGWDDQIPFSTHSHWKSWLEDLKKIPNFRINRCYSNQFEELDDLQLHVFGDGGEESYGAAAYFRMTKNGLVTTSLVIAKSKVTPLKATTIPRLELEAALIGSRLTIFVQQHIKRKIDRVVMWSDSSTALSQIRSESRRFKQYVATRVGEIQENTEVSSWRYVPTEENVADDLTKLSNKSDWSISSRWINGPSFLIEEEDKWPVQPNHSNKENQNTELRKEEIELLEEQVNFMKSDEIIHLFEITRFSSWIKLINSTVYLFRSIPLVAAKINKDFKSAKIQEIRGPITVNEIYKAERWWWKNVQRFAYGEEVETIKRGIKIEPRSRLKGLNLIVDEEQIMRVRGRLDLSPSVGYMTRRPVVLASKHPYTRLLIQHYHKMCGHHGHERIVNEIRQKYWIPGLRTAVKRAKQECQICKNDSAKPRVPEMGQLPAFRVAEGVHPFENTGLDYFGPVEVVVKRSRAKRWVALFTCLSTRAVHLELTYSLSTDSCILALRRFVSRRGTPAHIHSDNGTNFVGTSNELKIALQDLNQQQIEDECKIKGIQWHFIPPSAPHMGGSWERLVRSVKVALGKTLDLKNLSDEVLQTVLCEAEHTVNSHPLTHVPDDPDDPEALTPNHFLLGRSSNLQSIANTTQSDLFDRKQWRVVQQMTAIFWRRWVREYLPTLLRREKWCEQTRAIKIGDVVIEINENLTRNSWPKGIVVNLYPGKDGSARVVDIRRSNGNIYKRPVSKLCILDVQPPAIQDKTSSAPV